MVGREAALADVLRPGRVVWIEGEPGTGKTRLLAEVADRTACDRTALLYVACPRAAGALGVVPGPARGGRRPRAGEPPVGPRSRRAAQEPEVRRAALGGDIVARLRTASSRARGGRRRRRRAVGGPVRRRRAARGRRPDARRRPLDRRQPAGRPGTRRRPPCAGISSGRRPSAPSRSATSRRPTSPSSSRTSRPSSTPAARAALVAEVCASTDGPPALGRRVDRPPRPPRPDAERMPRLDAIVAGTLARLDVRDRRLVDVLAVAGGPCPVTVLAAGVRRPGGGGPRARRPAGRRGAPRPARRRRRRPAPRPRPARRRAAPAGRLGAGGPPCARPGAVARPTLGGRLRRAAAAGRRAARRPRPRPGPGGRRRRSSACSTAPTTWRAARLAERYLALGDAPDAGCDGLAAQLKAATALIAVGDVGPRPGGAGAPARAGPGQRRPRRLRRHDPGDGPADDRRARGGRRARRRRAPGRVRCRRATATGASSWPAGRPTSASSAAIACAPTTCSTSPTPTRAARPRCRASCWRSGPRPTRSWGRRRRRRAGRSTSCGATRPAPTTSPRRPPRCCSAPARRGRTGTLADVAAARDGIVGDRRPPAAPGHPLVAGGARRVDRARRRAPRRRRRRRSRRRRGIGRELRVVAAAPTARAQQLTMLYLEGTLGTAAEALAQFAAGPEARRSGWWPATGWPASRPVTSTARRRSPAGSPPSRSSSSGRGELAARRRCARPRSPSPPVTDRSPAPCGRRSSASAGRAWRCTPSGTSAPPTACLGKLAVLLGDGAARRRPAGGGGRPGAPSRRERAGSGGPSPTSGRRAAER